MFSDENTLKNVPSLLFRLVLVWREKKRKKKKQPDDWISGQELQLVLFQLDIESVA